jgi:hypothetical protein
MGSGGRWSHDDNGDVDLAEMAEADIQQRVHAKAGEGFMRRRLVEETGWALIAAETRDTTASLI